MSGTGRTSGGGAGSVFRLPAALRRDLVLLLAVKFAMLAVLYALFFSPGHRPPLDAATHLVGAPGLGAPSLGAPSLGTPGQR